MSNEQFTFKRVNGYECKVRHEMVDGVDEWLWPWDDQGLWLGPSQEWPAIKELILEHCKSFDTVLQAGGACGMYPKLLSNMFERVVTFEPDPINFFFLSHNCKDQRITKLNAVLGNDNRWSTFSYPVENNRGTGSVSFKENDPLAGDTLMFKGDNIVFKKLDLIYLDIEGGEYHAITGLINNIRLHKPIIICENAHAGIIDYLINFGYSVVARSNSDTVMKVIE